MRPVNVLPRPQMHARPDTMNDHFRGMLSTRIARSMATVTLLPLEDHVTLKNVLSESTYDCHQQKMRTTQPTN